MIRRYVVAILLLLFFVVHVFVVHVETIAAQSPAPSAGAATSEQRKTSEPYTGDLSVFESPGREDRLQINRVMDLLGIAAGKGVADIGAG